MRVAASAPSRAPAHACWRSVQPAWAAGAPGGYARWSRSRSSAAARLQVACEQRAETTLPLLQSLRPPKFQPFNPQSLAKQRALAFQRAVPCEGGVLLIEPVREGDIPDTAEILTDGFAESMGYVSVYRNFLRVQIRSYLQSHMQLPPKTVVLVARLLSEAEWAEVQAEPQQEGSAAGEAGPAEDDGKEGHSSEAAADSSSSNGLGIAALAQEGANQSHEQQQEEEQQQPQQPQGEEERRAAEQQARQEASVAPRLLLSTPFSVDSSVADMQPGSSGDESETVASTSRKQPGEIVGVVEVSFTPSTRTKHLTLNSPEQRPYLCNMAVAESRRGRGYGKRILAAAEELVEHVGGRSEMFGELYLHVRLQDTGATRLYEQAGYEVMKQDNPFVVLLRVDRRRLMRKRLWS